MNATNEYVALGMKIYKANNTKIKNHMDKSDLNNFNMDTLEIIIMTIINMIKAPEISTVVDHTVGLKKIQTMSKIKSNILSLGSNLWTKVL